MTPNPLPLRVDRNAVHSEQRRSLFRALAGTAIGRMRNASAADMIRASWPQDDNARFLVRAASSPLDRTQFPTITAIRLLPLIAPKSAATQLFEKALRLDFSGVGTISVPNASEVPGSLFVGEGKPIPVSQAALTAGAIGPVKKLALISGISREVQEQSPDNSASLIGRLMSQGASRALDRQVFSNAAATSDAPAGLLNGVTPIAAGTSMAADLGALVTAMTTANVIGETVLVVNPALALRMALLSFGALPVQVIASSQLSPTTIIAIGLDGIASGYDGAPSIEASTTPAVHFDTSALPINGGTPASAVMSSFQQDLILLKLKIWCAWGVVQAGAVQVINNVTW